MKQSIVFSGIALLIALVAGSTVRGEDSPTTQPATDWSDVAAVFGTGSEKGGVFSIVIPRTDLAVSVDGVDIPAEAGIESAFHFYACPCGKKNVIGQFVLAQYEVNDVIDALRGGNIQIASVAPLLLNERPRVMLVRFQGEGDAIALAKALKAALSWTGDARTATQPVK